MLQKRRLHQLSKACASGHNRLLRALTKYQLFASEDNHLSPQERVQLAGELEAISRLIADKDARDIEYLHCEQLYGLRRRFGTCCITPARKAIMDWMLDADSTKNQALTAHAASHLLTTQEGDILVEPSIFRAALTSFLCGARKKVLVKTATRLSSCLIAPAADESQAVARNRLRDLLFLLWIIVAVRRKAPAEADRIQANDLVRIQASPGRRQSNRMKHNGEMAIVSSVGTTGKGAKMQIMLPQGSIEMEIGSEELVPLFSSTGLASVLTDFESAIGRATQRLYSLVRLETMIEPYVSRHADRVSVLREVREHSWRTFKKESPIPTSKSFSQILETLSLIGESKDGDRMLQRLQDSERARESKRFSDLLRSRRLTFEEASYPKMLYLQASLLAEDAPVDSVRLIILALTTSLIDLCRIHARTSAEVVKLHSSASTALLPDVVVRDLYQHKAMQGGRANPGSTMTLILALENLSRLLSHHRDHDALPPRASALLFQTVSSIAINFITSHSRDFPTQPSSWTEKRWACISTDDWETINRLTDEVLAALDYEAKSKIKRLSLAVPCCGSEGLVALDPKSFYELQHDSSPLVLLTAPCNGHWHYTAMIDGSQQFIGWFESGLQVLKSETIESSEVLHSAARTADRGPAEKESFSSSASEALEMESTLDDISQEQATVDAEQTALETVVGFLKRTLCRRRSEQVATETIATFVKRALLRRQAEGRLHGGCDGILQAAGAGSHSQMVDVRQRMMRYKFVREATEPDGRRMLWNGNDLLARARDLGDAHYDRIKAR